MIIKDHRVGFKMGVALIFDEDDYRDFVEYQELVAPHDSQTKEFREDLDRRFPQEEGER